MNVAPRHLTAEAETLLSATLIHEVCGFHMCSLINNNAIYLIHHHVLFYTLQVMHVLGFDPHAFAHFRDERKRRRSQVNYS